KAIPLAQPQVNAEIQKTMGAVHNWITDPKNPTVLRPGTVADALRNNWIAPPGDEGAFKALVAYAIVNSPGADAQQLTERLRQQQLSATATPTSPEDIA